MSDQFEKEFLVDKHLTDTSFFDCNQDYDNTDYIIKIKGEDSIWI